MDNYLTASKKITQAEGHSVAVVVGRTNTNEKWESTLVDSLFFFQKPQQNSNNHE
jgi:hypothetical protein